ncbi:MAG TPA: NTP transferase domain-containing protein [Fibrobacteria bacterium]|nr:NTP transferase domain-containing protein [Fibrobacteria bacterium]
MPDVVCVVPARMASTRFPGKPLVDIAGTPMVVRSAHRALAAQCFSRVVVATEDREIAEVCERHGLEFLLTPACPTGTDRVAWAAGKLGADWIVNLQGDEPVFPMDLLRDLALLLPTDPDAMWTAADLVLSPADRADPDVVKIRLGVGDPADALDFHREIPNGSTETGWAVHVGIYGGSREALGRFSVLPVPDWEMERRIEPLRALAHRMRVRAVTGHWPRAAVDRREHISTVLEELRREGAQ